MTRIEKDYTFNSAVHFDNKFLINHYELTVSMIVETEAVHEQNVAMERLDYFINHVLDSCVFVDITKNKAIENYLHAGLRTCILPEEPYDQILGIILLLKLNSILENRLIVTDIILSSKLSDNVRFHVVQEVADNLYSGDNWWNENSTKLCDTKKLSDKKTKIVKLFDDDWQSVGLSWKEGKQVTNNT